MGPGQQPGFMHAAHFYLASFSPQIGGATSCLHVSAPNRKPQPMEADDDELPTTTHASSSTSSALMAAELAARPYLGVGLALGLGLLYAAGAARPSKPLSVAIKVADGALKGTRVLSTLHSPTPESFILASKALAQGYKVTKTLKLIRPPEAPKPISALGARLKPCVGAVNVLRYARSLVTSDAGILGFGAISYGYKLSKNALRVLEGFVGIELDAAVRGGVDAVGLVVKAVKVAREIGKLAEAGDDGTRSSCCFLLGPSGRGQRYALHRGFRLGVCGDGFDGRGPVGVEKMRFELFFPQGSDMGLLLGGEGLGLGYSEILCLSVPVAEKSICHAV